MIRPLSQPMSIREIHIITQLAPRFVKFRVETCSFSISGHVYQVRIRLSRTIPGWLLLVHVMRFPHDNAKSLRLCGLRETLELPLPVSDWRQESVSKADKLMMSLALSSSR